MGTRWTDACDPRPVTIRTTMAEAARWTGRACASVRRSLLTLVEVGYVVANGRDVMLTPKKWCRRVRDRLPRRSPSRARWSAASPGRRRMPDALRAILSSVRDDDLCILNQGAGIAVAVGADRRRRRPGKGCPKGERSGGTDRTSRSRQRLNHQAGRNVLRLCGGHDDADGQAVGGAGALGRGLRPTCQGGAAAPAAHYRRDPVAARQRGVRMWAPGVPDAAPPWWRVLQNTGVEAACA